MKRTRMPAVVSVVLALAVSGSMARAAQDKYTVRVSNGLAFSVATTAVPDSLHDVDFMVKDGKRFADSGGWGWGAFEYNPTSGTFTPADMSAKPPQGHDAKCGFACHTVVKNRDYVFTEYGKR